MSKTIDIEKITKEWHITPSVSKTYFFKHKNKAFLQRFRGFLYSIGVNCSNFSETKDKQFYFYIKPKIKES